MKVSRRMFMRAAPAAPVVAQQAVKDIATKAALSVVGGASGGVPIGYGGAIAQAGGYESARRGAVSYIGDLIRSGKRPEWRVGTDRLQARRRAIMLDADVGRLSQCLRPPSAACSSSASTTVFSKRKRRTASMRLDGRGC